MNDVVDSTEQYFEALKRNAFTNVLEAIAAKYSILDRDLYGLDALLDPPGGLDKRPDVRVHELCVFAIVGSPKKSLSQRQIRAAIARRYPYFAPDKVEVVDKKGMKRKVAWAVRSLTRYRFCQYLY